MEFVMLLLLVISASASLYSDDKDSQVENILRSASDLDVTLDDVDWKSGLLLNTIWNSLQRERDNESEPKLDNVSLSDVDIKEPNAKRFSNEIRQKENNYKLPYSKAQRRWNIKKGKGYPSMCYFKICSFKIMKL